MTAGAVLIGVIAALAVTAAGFLTDGPAATITKGTNMHATRKRGDHGSRRKRSDPRRKRRLLRVAVLIAALIAAGELQAATPWCGIYARHHLVAVDPGPAFNRACKWLDYGTPTTAHAGVMVIWCTRGGHAVRTRLRSVAGAQFRE